MYLDLSAIGADCQFFLSGSYSDEKTESKLCKRILKPGMVFVDMGAHIGYYAFLAFRLVGRE